MDDHSINLCPLDPSRRHRIQIQMKTVSGNVSEVGVRFYSNSHLRDHNCKRTQPPKPTRKGKKNKYINGQHKYSPENKLLQAPAQVRNLAKVALVLLAV